MTKEVKTDKTTGMLGRHEDKADSREAIEAHVLRCVEQVAEYGGRRHFVGTKGDRENLAVFAEDICGLLDRQAAITKKECADSWQGIAEDKDKAQMKCAVLQSKVDELTKERDELRAKTDIFGEEIYYGGTIRDWYENAANLGKQVAELKEELADLKKTHMRLPVDADGVPIRPGDVVCYFQDGQRMHVHGVCEEGLFYTHEGEKGQVPPMPPSGLRHVKPDTVESLLDQFQAHITDDILVCDLEELIDEYAERIRKAVER